MLHLFENRKIANVLSQLLVTVQKISAALGLIVFISILLYSLPAQAASRINPQMEEQVLQILRQHPEVIIESVQAYQQRQNQQIQKAQQSFMQQLQTNPQQIIGNSPTTGNIASKIVLVEFSDFQCPYCAQAHKTVKQFLKKHQEEVALTYKHYPLVSIHSEAMLAAKAAWASGKQGKFWEYHDALFTQQDKLGETLYVDIAKKLNLDLEKFTSDRTSQSAGQAVNQDIQLAESLGLSGTPFFIMNGKTFTGAVQLSEMEKILASH
jgi:protein-disulfide isomerase